MYKCRTTVGIVLVYKGLIFIGKNRDYWSMPQGGIEIDESPIDSAKRELYEETGIIDIVEWKRESSWYILELPNPSGFYAKTKISYQKYKWFLCNLLEEPKINLCHHEFQGYKWDNSINVCEQVIPFKQEMYRNVLYWFDLLPQFEDYNPVY